MPEPSTITQPGAVVRAHERGTGAIAPLALHKLTGSSATYGGRLVEVGARAEDSAKSAIAVDMARDCFRCSHGAPSPGVCGVRRTYKMGRFFFRYSYLLAPLRGFYPPREERRGEGVGSNSPRNISPPQDPPLPPSWSHHLEPQPLGFAPSPCVVSPAMCRRLRGTLSCVVRASGGGGQSHRSDTGVWVSPVSEGGLKVRIFYFFGTRDVQNMRGVLRHALFKVCTARLLRQQLQSRIGEMPRATRDARSN